MSEPVLEQIAVAMQAALEDIEGLAVVIRPKRTGLQTAPGDHTIVLTQGDAGRAREHDVVGNPAGQGWMQQFLVDCYIRTSDADETAIETRLNRMIADVQAVVGGNVQWGGLAIDSEATGVLPIESEDGQLEGSTLLVNVTYRVAENDPTTQV